MSDSYRLKISFYYGGFFEKDDIVEEGTRGYYYKKGNPNPIGNQIVKLNPDIFQPIEEPEPQEEVIEGWAMKYEDTFEYIKHYKFQKKKVTDLQIPATLILNSKPKKEYVRWVSNKGMKDLNENEFVFCIPKKSDSFIHKIKITVEEE